MWDGSSCTLQKECDKHDGTKSTHVRAGLDPPSWIIVGHLGFNVRFY